jgi:hypothetical protein
MKQVFLHIVEVYHFQKLIMHLLNDKDVKELIMNYNFVQQLHHLYMVQQLLLREMNGVIHHEHIQQHKRQDQNLNQRLDLIENSFFYLFHQLRKVLVILYQLDQHVLIAIEDYLRYFLRLMNHFDNHMPNYYPIQDDLLFFFEL